MFGFYKRKGKTYVCVNSFDLEDVLRDPRFACRLPSPKPAHRCIDDQGWPVTPCPKGCYRGKACRSNPSPGRPWHLPIRTVKKWLKVPGSNVTLVASITPNRKTSDLVAEIASIWGYYYPAWTPAGPWTVIMLKLKMLWVDVAKISTLPHSFPAPPKDKPRRSVFEFLYATFRNGRWYLNSPGRYNYALLYPDALEYFFRVIREELKKDPESCGEGLDLCDCVCR